MTIPSYPNLKSLPSAVRDQLAAGIVDPDHVTLAPNLRLCRFTDRQYGPDQGLISPWWMTENDFNKIVAAREHSRRAHGGDKSRSLSMGFLARWAAAVPQEWQQDGGTSKSNTVDLLLRADLRVSVDAFVGRGRAQREQSPNGITVTWSGWPSITQLFIPAFSLKQQPPATLHDVLQMLSVGAPTYVTSHQLYART